MPFSVAGGLVSVRQGVYGDGITRGRGKQPRCMSLLWFQRNPLPTDWGQQRAVVAAFDR
jgi:hypothetical protein